ncbi:Unknown protein, partial [Striga hermonthica]
YGDWLKATDGNYGYKSNSATTPESHTDDNHTTGQGTGSNPQEDDIGFKSADSGVRAGIGREVSVAENAASEDGNIITGKEISIANDETNLFQGATSSIVVAKGVELMDTIPEQNNTSTADQGLQELNTTPKETFGPENQLLLETQGLETIFEITECTERQRIICAQLQMTGDARLWWNSYWGMRPGEKENLTWMQFKEMMEEKYYPALYRAEMERQFLALSQGNRTVDEYEREFTRLGSFVKYLVDTEAKKARRFQDGLQREI